MKIKMTVQEFDETVNSIRYGPKIYQGTGCYSDTDVIRY